MALDYAGSSDLMGDVEFRGRVKVACLKYATYITAEPANVPAHATRIKWSQQALVSPDAAAAQVVPVVVMDPGRSIADRGRDQRKQDDLRLARHGR
jgi:hypothetical protein